MGLIAVAPVLISTGNEYVTATVVFEAGFTALGGEISARKSPRISCPGRNVVAAR